jgi:hypothetical protein
MGADQPVTPPAPPADPEPKPAEPTETPGATPELGDAGKKALDTERKARRDAEARLKELEPLAQAAQEKADAEKTELQKASEALATERDARTQAEAALLRYEVGVDKSVPPKLVKFLVGATKEEIEASADALLAELGNGERPGVPAKPTERMASGKPSSTLDTEDPAALIHRARQRD